VPFRDIAGHARLRSLLAAAAHRGTLPPSLIFAGPEGVGKRRTAIALAQLLNCPSPGDEGLDACGVCPSCRRIARGVHADVMTIEPEVSGSIKIDQVREAIERAAYRPFEGRRRVVIVDDADALQPEAQNALLKTLEEPPPSSVFVLVTARPDLLLTTVRSRCQRARFGRLTAADVASVLVRDFKVDPAEARAAASAGDGTVRSAIERDSESAEVVREAAVGLLQVAARASEPGRRLDAAKLLGSGGRGASERDVVARRLTAVASLLRDLGVLIEQGDPESLANADLRAELDALRPAFDGERVVRAFQAVHRAVAALDRNASPKIVADWIALQI
jgi:DNA polymerase-3 subunit delta'